jgi:hypothetical protein
LADFYGILIATSFRVKDVAAFRADPDFERLMDKASEGFQKPDDKGYWAFGWEDQYPSPVFQTSNAEGEERDHDMLEFVQRHIHPEDACVVMVSGHEKLRYGGYGIWIVTAGSVVSFPFGQVAWDTRYTRVDVESLVSDFAGQIPKKPVPLLKPLDRKVAKAMAEANDGEVKAVIVVDITELGESVDALNDLADEKILGELSGLALMNINYRVVGYVEGKTGGHFLSGGVLLEVSGELDNYGGFDDDEDAETQR